jgi:hypothetical protein
MPEKEFLFLPLPPSLIPAWTCSSSQRSYLVAQHHVMDCVFEDWPWAETNEHLVPASDLLDDLALPHSSKSCYFEQHSFDWDEDLLAQLDDFILFPETASEGLESFDKPSLPSQYDGETASQSSPATSFTEPVSSPVVSLADVPNQSGVEDQPNVGANLDIQRPHRRRRQSTVFPCMLCKRVCFTSVEARPAFPHTLSCILFHSLTLVVDDTTLDILSPSSVRNPQSSLCSRKTPLNLDRPLQQYLHPHWSDRDVAKHSQQRMSSKDIGKASTIASQKSDQRSGSSVLSADAKLLRGYGREETICWST